MSSLVIRLGLRSSRCVRPLVAVNFSVLSARNQAPSQSKAIKAYPKVLPKIQCFSFHTSALKWQFDEVDLRDEVCMSHDDFVDAVRNDQIQVVDVRTPEEVDEGHVRAKRYVNIPVQELEEALQLPENDFKTKYGIEKPPKDASDLVFHCRRGGRSTFALRLAQSAGYNKVKHYPGGWEEWSTKA